MCNQLDLEINDALYPHGRAIYEFLKSVNEPLQAKHITNGANVPATAVIAFLAYLDGAKLLRITPNGLLHTPERTFAFRKYELIK